MSSSIPPSHTNMPQFNESEFNDLEEVSQQELNFYNTRYVGKSGDTMTGTLNIAQNLNVSNTLTLTNPITLSNYVAATSGNQIGFTWSGSAGTNLTRGAVATVIYYNAAQPPTYGLYLIQLSFRLSNTGASAATLTALKFGVSWNGTSFLYPNNIVEENGFSQTVSTVVADQQIYNFTSILSIASTAYIFGVVQATFTGSTIRAESYGSMTRIA